MKKGIMGGIALILAGIAVMWNAFYWGSALVPEEAYFTDLWWSMPWMFTNIFAIMALAVGGIFCISYTVEQNIKEDDE